MTCYLCCVAILVLLSCRYICLFSSFDKTYILMLSIDNAPMNKLGSSI